MLQEKISYKSNLFKKSAFTLAEVLITISIIGIVASLTVPTLATKYTAKVWDSGSKVFSTRLSNAIYEMIQTGNMDGYSTTLEFVNELGKYITFTKVCDSNHLTDCFVGNFIYDNETINTSNLKTARDIGLDYYNTEVVSFRTKFGVNGLLTYNSNCATVDAKKIYGDTPCVTYIIDTNGDDNPNIFGEDIKSGGNGGDGTSTLYPGTINLSPNYYPSSPITGSRPYPSTSIPVSRPYPSTTTSGNYYPSSQTPGTRLYPSS